MALLKTEITEKILYVLCDLYQNKEEQMKFSTMCNSARLGQIRYHLRDALLEKHMIFEDGKRFYWNEHFAKPNIKMAEVLHKECNKRIQNGVQKKNLRVNIDNVSDEQLVNILRERGYTVIATKEVTTTISL